MSVSEAQARIGSAEFAEWMAFYRLEPFGDERADLRAGIIASTVATVGAQGRKQFTAKDFMPDFGERKRQSLEDMQAVLSHVSNLATAARGRAKPKDKPAPKRSK